MKKRRIIRRNTLLWLRSLSILLLATLLLQFAVVAPARAENGNDELKADPNLLQLVADHPDEVFPVIVQKDASKKDQPDEEPEVSVEKAGGKVNRDKKMDFIVSFSAELSGREIEKLSRHPKVRWISLDAPLFSTAVGDPTVRDEFATVSYNNNNGTQAWAGDWIETGDGSVSASSGYVKIDRGQLKLSNPNRTLSRQANLAGAISATLSFKYKRSSLDDANDYVAIQVSANGGSTWTELARYAGKASDSNLLLASFDILSYAAANTQIRFATSATLGSGDILYVDDLQIEYTVLNGSSNSETELITLNSTSSAVTGAAAGNLTWSHTVNNGYNRILTVSVLMSSGYQSTNVTFGGAPLTLIGRQSGSKHVVEIWRLVAPPVGTANIVANFSGSLQAIGGAAAYNNVNQSTPTGTFMGAVGTSSSPASVTVSSAPEELVIDAMITDVNSTVTPGAGNTQRWFQDYTGMDRLGRGGSKAGDTSVTMSWNGPADDWSIGAVSLKPAPISSFVRAVRANELWSTLQGQGVTVALVDSGINPHADLQVIGGGSSRIVASTTVRTGTPADDYGHGTHVAGVIGGNGSTSGVHIGIAPGANLINVKVSDNTGMSLGSDLVAGLQWVYDNRQTYNIKVVNISMNSSVAESYHTSPIDAAVEILWFNGIVVVVSAGNNGGPGTLYPPANDPFVITAGAADDMGTATIADDGVASFSAYGTTESGFIKPDLVAPGRNLISLNASINSNIYNNYASHRVDNNYFRMSGTSMSAPVVSGAVALLLQDEPTLTPDQVKYRLMATANKAWAGYSSATAGAGYLDIYAAVYGTTIESANTGLTASQLLWTGSEPITWGSVAWNSVAWNSVAWNSVAWNSVAWNSVAWNSVAWNSDYWGP